ncbi:MBL fold metallo-hydrolase [Lentisalinibacter orientalis]|uniref:MBL fold metallo-hydrolase n=1 Tax=Lentisalinibacter orientalis TaxID=2992241 RepID=UPI00386FFFF7
MKWRMIMAAAAAATAVAAGPAQAQDDMADVEIGVTDLGDGLYMLTGRGGNMGLSVGEDATFLIDDQFAPLTPKIKSAIAGLTENSVKFVFNTHWHFDHVGGNENFGETGAVIVAHDNVRERMSEDQFLEAFNQEVPASPPEALPVVTFNDKVTLHLNGETIRAFHTPHAHTDGDSVIYFDGANVFHMGDTFFHKMYPFIDGSSGGTVDGVIEAANTVLAMSDEDSVIIPGHGPIATRDDLRAYRDMLATVRDSVKAMIGDGMTLEQVQAANPTADFDAVHNEMGMFEPAQWVGLLYGLLAPAEDAGEE